MYDLPTYRFDGYTFRPATPADLPLARRWNAADPEHAWEMQYPEFWIEQNAQANSYVLEDQWGIVFFVKSIRHMVAEVEITLQFDRQRRAVSEQRAALGLIAGIAWLKKALPMNGFRAVYFISKNQKLIAFAENRLGFIEDGARYVCALETKEEGDGRKVDTEGGGNDEAQRDRGRVRQGHAEEDRRREEGGWPAGKARGVCPEHEEDRREA
jgi:hypothetical protein